MIIANKARNCYYSVVGAHLCYFSSSLKILDSTRIKSYKSLAKKVHLCNDASSSFSSIHRSHIIDSQVLLHLGLLLLERKAQLFTCKEGSQTRVVLLEEKRDADIPLINLISFFQAKRLQSYLKLSFLIHYQNLTNLNKK